MDREADDEEGAERELADRVGGADREALAEVVQADPDRDHQREADAAGAAGVRPRSRAAAQPAVERRQRQVGDRGAEEEQLGAAEGAARLAARSRAPSSVGVDGEERRAARS